MVADCSRKKKEQAVLFCFIFKEGVCSSRNKNGHYTKALIFGSLLVELAKACEGQMNCWRSSTELSISSRIVAEFHPPPGTLPISCQGKSVFSSSSSTSFLKQKVFTQFRNCLIDPALTIRRRCLCDGFIVCWQKTTKIYDRPIQFME